MPYADKDKQRDYQRQWAARRRAEFMAGKCCLHCGSEDNLELHHRDPTQKESHRIWTWAKKRIIEEMEKCDILCEDCHTEAHAPKHGVGTTLYKREGCRCGPCKAEKAAEYQRLKMKNTSQSYSSQSYQAQQSQR